ncbi:MAG: TlpA family protein disulfide reductase [Marinilabiliaceae bacterium]
MKNKLLLITILAGIGFLSFINGSHEPGEGLEVGNKIPTIDMQLLDGSPLHTDSLKGKMVLLDFWASYDAKSRTESYKKRDIYNKYKDASFLNGKELVIVSISLDRFKTPLKQAIERDNMHDFNHICTFNGRESELATRFDANEELTNFLVDGEGRIVASTGDIEKIEQKLAKLKR